MLFPFELAVDLPTFLMLAAVAFTAGFIDAIAGGGGLPTGLKLEDPSVLLQVGPGWQAVAPLCMNGGLRRQCAWVGVSCQGSTRGHRVGARMGVDWVVWLQAGGPRAACMPGMHVSDGSAVWPAM